MFSQFRIALETLGVDPALAVSNSRLSRGVLMLPHVESSVLSRDRSTDRTGVSSGSDLDDGSTRVGCDEEDGVEVGDVATLFCASKSSTINDSSRSFDWRCARSVSVAMRPVSLVSCRKQRGGAERR